MGHKADSPTTAWCSDAMCLIKEIPCWLVTAQKIQTFLQASRSAGHKSQSARFVMKCFSPSLTVEVMISNSKLTKSNHNSSFSRCFCMHNNLLPRCGSSNARSRQQWWSTFVDRVVWQREGLRQFKKKKIILISLVKRRFSYTINIGFYSMNFDRGPRPFRRPQKLELYCSSV